MSAGSKSASPANAGVAKNANATIPQACGRDIGAALAKFHMGQRRKKLRNKYTNTAMTASGTAQPIQTGGDQRRVSGRASRLIADAARNEVPSQPNQCIAGPD